MPGDPLPSGQHNVRMIRLGASGALDDLLRSRNRNLCHSDLEIGGEKRFNGGVVEFLLHGEVN